MLQIKHTQENFMRSNQFANDLIQQWKNLSIIELDRMVDDFDLRLAEVRKDLADLNLQFREGRYDVGDSKSTHFAVLKRLENSLILRRRIATRLLKDARLTLVEEKKNSDKEILYSEISRLKQELADTKKELGQYKHIASQTPPNREKMESKLKKLQDTVEEKMHQQTFTMRSLHLAINLLSKRSLKILIKKISEIELKLIHGKPLSIEVLQTKEYVLRRIQQRIDESG